MPAGETVLLALASANRDPQHIPNPDEIDLDRHNAGHLGFGHGPHYCLGAPLARMEARTALVDRDPPPPGPRPRRPREELPWKIDHRQHALTALPVTFTAQPAD